MDKQEYINRLIELKQFLKRNPHLRKVYSDIHIEEQISESKHSIMDDMDNPFL